MNTLTLSNTSIAFDERINYSNSKGKLIAVPLSFFNSVLKKANYLSEEDLLESYNQAKIEIKARKSDGGVLESVRNIELGKYKKFKDGKSAAAYLNS